MQRRHTSVRIVIFAIVLQSASSILSLLSYHTIAWRDLSASYSSLQRAAWLVAVVCSTLQIAAGVLLLRRTAWARGLYMATAALSITLYFALLPGTVALSAVPACVATMAVLAGRMAFRYFAEPQQDHRATARDIVAAASLIGATALLYRIYLALVTGQVWCTVFKHDVLYVGGLPLVALLLAAGLVLSPQTTRHWRAGMVLAVSAVAITNALIGYLPYSQMLAHLPGAPARLFEIPWGSALSLLLLLVVIADQCLRKSRPARPPLDLPNFS